MTSLCSFLRRAAFLPLLWALSPAHGEVHLPYPQGTAFPLELYEVKTKDTQALTASHWNTFQSYGITRTDDCSAYLAALRGSDVAGLVAIGCTGKKPDKIEWPEAKVQTWIRDIATNSNLAWWDLPEEARPWSAHEVQMLRDYTAWTRRYDPGCRPTYEYTPNNRNAAELSHIVPTVDIIGVSCYCEEMRMPHAWVRYKIQEAGLHGIALAGATVGNDYLHGQKIPIAIIYCAKFPKTGMVPTPDETYHDFWSAIVSGARGIGVYAYYHAMNDDPSLAKNFERLSEAAAQIAAPENIGNAILWGKPNPGVSFEILAGPQKTVSFRPPTEKVDFQYPSLNVLSKIKSGTVYVIAVNSTDQSVTARVTGLPSTGTSAALPFENRSISISVGRMTDEFKPWGVHIYKLRSDR